jgi:hypothetical protein
MKMDKCKRFQFRVLSELEPKFLVFDVRGDGGWMQLGSHAAYVTKDLDVSFRQLWNRHRCIRWIAITTQC